MKIVSADSGAALLNDHFEPLHVVAACSVLVEPPYRKATCSMSEAIFRRVEEGPELVVHELELCRGLLKTLRADVIHLDMSFGGLSVDELSAVSLSRLRVSSKARGHLLRILPKLRKISLEIKQGYNIDVLAIGKESVPVRIAELTAGAHAVLYAAEKAVKEASPKRLGLPARCTMNVDDNRVILESLIPVEQDLVGHAEDENNVVKEVQMVEMPNPCARGFRLLEISACT